MPPPTRRAAAATAADDDRHVYYVFGTLYPSQAQLDAQHEAEGAVGTPYDDRCSFGEVAAMDLRGLPVCVEHPHHGTNSVGKTPVGRVLRTTVAADGTLSVVAALHTDRGQPGPVRAVARHAREEMRAGRLNAWSITLGVRHELDPVTGRSRISAKRPVDASLVEEPHYATCRVRHHGYPSELSGAARARLHALTDNGGGGGGGATQSQIKKHPANPPPPVAALIHSRAVDTARAEDNFECRVFRDLHEQHQRRLRRRAETMAEVTTAAPVEQTPTTAATTTPATAASLSGEPAAKRARTDEPAAQPRDEQGRFAAGQNPAGSPLEGKLLALDPTQLDQLDGASSRELMMGMMAEFQKALPQIQQARQLQQQQEQEKIAKLKDLYDQMLQASQEDKESAAKSELLAKIMDERMQAMHGNMPHLEQETQLWETVLGHSRKEAAARKQAEEEARKLREEKAALERERELQERRAHQAELLGGLHAQLGMRTPSLQVSSAPSPMQDSLRRVRERDPTPTTTPSPVTGRAPEPAATPEPTMVMSHSRRRMEEIYNRVMRASTDNGNGVRLGAQALGVLNGATAQ